MTHRGCNNKRNEKKCASCFARIIFNEYLSLSLSGSVLDTLTCERSAQTSVSTLLSCPLCTVVRAVSALARCTAYNFNASVRVAHTKQLAITHGTHMQPFMFLYASCFCVIWDPHTFHRVASHAFVLSWLLRIMYMCVEWCSSFLVHIYYVPCRFVCALKLT